MKKLTTLFLILLSGLAAAFAQEPTYAERLGFPQDAKVVILHVDDVGMSWGSNAGAIDALENGVATSVSVMMPCAWVPGFLHYLKEHPDTDAGLHLTLTSEWEDYRWGPLMGKPAVPGLVDHEGALWHTVAEVVAHATADEVEAEIRAQLVRATEGGFQPTHLDSHMGTLFAKPEFMERYLKLGMENNIPVMFPGGHNTMIKPQFANSPEVQQLMVTTGKMLWDAGLPVLDDLHNISYGFKYPDDPTLSDHELREIATRHYIASFKELEPGLTMVIMHCTQPTEVFPHITDSGNIRRGDLLAMTNPAFRAYLEKEGIILTTWREVMARRRKVK